MTGLVNTQSSSTAVDPFSPHVVGSLSPLEEFTEPVYNEVHHEQVAAGDTTQNIPEFPVMQEKVIDCSCNSRCCWFTSSRWRVYWAWVQSSPSRTDRCRRRWLFRIFLKLLSVGDIIADRRGVRPSAGAAWYRHLSKSWALQNDEWSSIVSRARCRGDATSLIPGFSKSVQNMKGDNWRMTLPPFPMIYSASATRLRKSNVTFLQLFGNDNACLHYGLLTTASEDA